MNSDVLSLFFVGILNCGTEVQNMNISILNIYLSYIFKSIDNEGKGDLDSTY